MYILKKLLSLYSLQSAVCTVGILTWQDEFPWPQTILKQLEEWHAIVSCNQLGATFRTHDVSHLYIIPSLWILNAIIEDVGGWQPCMSTAVGKFSFFH